MAQLKIKQIAQLKQTLDAITGTVTVVEEYIPSEGQMLLSYPARERSAISVHVNGLYTEDYHWEKDGVVLETVTLDPGTELIFNSETAGYELTGDDFVKITYEYLSNGNVTYTGAQHGYLESQMVVEKINTTIAAKSSEWNLELSNLVQDDEMSYVTVYVNGLKTNGLTAVSGKLLTFAPYEYNLDNTDTIEVHYIQMYSA